MVVDLYGKRTDGKAARPVICGGGRAGLPLYAGVRGRECDGCETRGRAAGPLLGGGDAEDPLLEGPGLEVIIARAPQTRFPQITASSVVPPRTGGLSGMGAGRG
jgi:hypothetical protein